MAKKITDKSLIGSKSDEKIEYINECVREVCINGADLNNYEKMIGKLFPNEENFYMKVSAFITECGKLSSKSSISATFIANLKYLAREIHVTDDTVKDITRFAEQELQKRKKEAEQERRRREDERKAEEERKRREDERKAEEERKRREDERKAKEERRRREAERKAEEERKRREAERKTEKERKRREAERKAEEERKRKQRNKNIIIFGIIIAVILVVRFEDYIIPMQLRNDSSTEIDMKEEDVNSNENLSAEEMRQKGDDFYDGKNYSEAIFWYTTAAIQGDAEAQTKLGYCYSDGHGVAQDYVKAFKWFKKAAEQGNDAAQANVGFYYQTGKGVTKDRAKAVEWYKKAAEQGNRHAQKELGDCYQYGWGVTKDRAKAVEWYKKAAEQGNRDAQRELEDLMKN